MEELPASVADFPHSANSSTNRRRHIPMLEHPVRHAENVTEKRRSTVRSRMFAATSFTPL
jgi:hypothetical protein